MERKTYILLRESPCWIEGGPRKYIDNDITIKQTMWELHTKEIN